MAELRAKSQLRASPALFTAYEIGHCRSRPDPAASAAGLVSAKEAFIKALSSLGGAPPYTFPEIEVVHGPSGEPRLRPHGELARWCAAKQLTIELSISHTGEVAGAVVVLHAPGGDTAGATGTDTGSAAGTCTCRSTATDSGNGTAGAGSTRTRTHRGADAEGQGRG